jgi:hypothetical protein
LVGLSSWRLPFSSVGVFGHLGMITFSKGRLQIYSDAAKFSKRRLVSFFIRSLENCILVLRLGLIVSFDSCIGCFSFFFVLS